MDPKLTYRPDIDGLRAVAVLAVVVFHAFPSLMRGGFIGVDVFFVISGYLISAILLANLRRDRFSLLDFYYRRVRRIFPALVTVMGVMLVVGWVALLPSEYAQLGKHTAGGAAFVSNLALYNESGYFDSEAASKLLLHLWSLAVEEQFYILWPLLLSLVWHKKRGFLAMVAAVAAVSFLANLTLTQHDPAAAFYWPITRFWELMAGGALAWVTLHQPAWAGGWANTKSMAGAVLLAAGFVLIGEGTPFPGWRALLPVLGTTLMIAAGQRAWINRALSVRPAVWIGLISYPLYLWHWPLLSMAHVIEGGGISRNLRIALVIASFLLAWLTFVFVERPVRIRKQIGIPALGACMVALLAAGATVYARGGFPARHVAGVVRSAPPNFNMGAHTSGPDGSCVTTDEILAAHCIAMVNPRSDKQVVVWGDSQALGWTKAAIEAGRRGGYGVTIISTEGCPPLIGVRQVGIEPPCGPLGTTDKMLDAILRTQPSVVVLVARWDLYYHGFTRNGRIEKTSHFLSTEAGAVTPETTREALITQLPATVAEVARAGAIPVVALNPPVLNGNVTNLRREVQVTRDHHLHYQAFIRTVLASYRGRVFDPSVKLCRTGVCALTDDSGNALYFDDNHLTDAGSMYLYPEIREVLRVP